MYSDYCLEWQKNKNINPITKRAISENGAVYKQFVKHCDKIMSVKHNIKNFCEQNKNLKEFINSKDEEYYNKLMQFCKSMLKDYDWGKPKAKAKEEKPKAKEEKPKAKEEKPKAKQEKPKAKENKPKVKEEKSNLDKYLSKLANNECIKLTKVNNQYLLTDDILLYKQIGSDSVFGVIYKSMNINKEYKDIPEFVTKIQLNSKQFTNEHRILEKIMKLKEKQPNICLIPDIYKIITCKNLIINDKYPSVLAKANKTNKKYTMILYELADGDLLNLLMKKTLNEEIWKNMYEQVIMSIFFYHSVFKELHADTHTKNFLYRKIAPGGCFCYNINGENYYIENLGYIFMIWDYGNSQPLEKLSNPSWIDDYINFNLGPRKRDIEIEKSDFFKYYSIHQDKEFGYLPTNYDIPKSVFKLQEKLAHHIYYESYKKPQSNIKYFMPNTPGSVTEYQWFKQFLDTGLLFSKKPIGKVISTITFNNSNIYYYSGKK
jgi:hypothetical protein